MGDPLRIHIVPQSHIDVVWLWRYDPETIHRCCAPTFTRALDNMDRFPEYTFVQSQVPLFEPMETVYPAVFQRIKDRVAEGRWEIVGGMYVEPEGSEPCGESWVRQCVMGKRYFQQTFGLDVRTGWQSDAWGHPSQLPQIMSKSGIDAYLWRRGDAGGSRTDVQESMFWWQAPDGSRVLACRFIDPEAPPFPGWERTALRGRERYGVHDTLVVIGGGDHGGGPDPDEIEATLQWAEEVAPDVSVEFSTFARFAETVLAQEPRLPTVETELGFELHADMTNCGEIKKNNRFCENLLIASEKWACVAALVSQNSYPQEELEQAWRKLLFNQFHDILGGSLIPEAYDDAMILYRSVRESGSHVLKTSLAAISERIDTAGESLSVIVFNALSWARTDVVELDLPAAILAERPLLRDESGRTIPVQKLERLEGGDEQRIRCVCVARDIPSMGYSTYRLAEEGGGAGTAETVTGTDRSLENEFFRVELDPVSGYVSRIVDKREGIDILEDSQWGNTLVAIEDEGDSEGRFVIGDDTVGKPPGRETEIGGEPLMHPVEKGPVRAALRIERPYRNSRFIQEIRLYAEIERIDFRLTVDWHDVHTMIKVAFPLALDTPEVTYDAPYATVVRPADGIEYPAQKWVDLFDAERGAEGYGVSLLNDARYGHDVQGNVVRMSVLRSPTEPAELTEAGTHILAYSLFPHRGSWRAAGVKRTGYAFNQPLTAVAETAHDGPLTRERSFFTVEPGNVLLEVVKRAYDSDEIVLRLVETDGTDCRVRVVSPARILRAYETDLLERDCDELRASGTALDFDIQGHEIKTIRVGFAREGSLSTL